MAREISELERARAAYAPEVPGVLRRPVSAISIEVGRPTLAVDSHDAIREQFPQTFGRPILQLVEGEGSKAVARPLAIGVVLSGGQAPGGHNVISGMFDALRSAHAGSRLLGFRGGPKGILDNDHVELTAERVDPYRNTGGFDIIGSGRDKLDTPAQLETCRSVCAKLGLDGLVVVGGDDSNTNAALLAEYFANRGEESCVVGVPKTIDGDLQGEHLEISFGFDTATKLYSELIGNICRDARSARKYWHFIRLMGRSASHVTLECVLRTHANIALIAEEIRERKMTLRQIVERIAEVISRRSAAGKDYGVCLVPEGLIEFIPEVGVLIDELNAILHDHSVRFVSLSNLDEQRVLVLRELTAESERVFGELPARIQEQLLLGRDSHGNVRVSQIDTEQLLLERVGRTLDAWKSTGKFAGTFAHQAHFLGYEGRCAAPSNFDANYTYSLGRLAVALTAFGQSGYMCSIRGLAGPRKDWTTCGVPLTSMMHVEMRKGRPTPVIAKALVDTNGEAFGRFAGERERWEIEDDYVYPGPIQYFGPEELTDGPPRSLSLAGGR